MKKTGKLLIVDEGHESFGISGEIATRIMPEVFYDLEAPVKRLGTADVPLPFSPVPISFTNLAIYLAAYVLGMKACTISYLIYMLLGMVGIPVFSGFTAGVGNWQDRPAAISSDLS